MGEYEDNVYMQIKQVPAIAKNDIRQIKKIIITITWWSGMKFKLHFEILEEHFFQSLAIAKYLYSNHDNFKLIQYRIFWKGFDIRTSCHGTLIHINAFSDMNSWIFIENVKWNGF